MDVWASLRDLASLDPVRSAPRSSCPGPTGPLLQIPLAPASSFLCRGPRPQSKGELPQVSLPPNSHWGRSREGKGQPGPRSSSFQHTMMVTVAMSAQQGGVLWAVPPGVTHTSEQKHVSSPAYAPHVYSAPRSPGLCPAVCRPTSSVRPILCKIKHQFSSSATKRWGVGENIFLASCWEDG